MNWEALPKHPPHLQSWRKCSAKGALVFRAWRAKQKLHSMGNWKQRPSSGKNHTYNLMWLCSKGTCFRCPKKHLQFSSVRIRLVNYNVVTCANPPSWSVPTNSEHIKNWQSSTEGPRPWQVFCQGRRQLAHKHPRASAGVHAATEADRKLSILICFFYSTLSKTPNWSAQSVWFKISWRKSSRKRTIDAEGKDAGTDW